MFKKPLIVIISVVLLLIAALCTAAGCSQQKPAADPVKQPDSSDISTDRPYLQITGNGVERETQYTLEDLKSMEDALAGDCYSTINNWPVKKFFVGRGVLLDSLLQNAGLKEEARIILITASDGYKIALTREQLEEKRFSYPALLRNSVLGAREVPAILAWEYREGTEDMSKAVPGKLRLLMGQQGLNDVVTAAFVKDVVSVEVLTTAPGQWEPVQADPAPGSLKQGAEVVISHPQQDLVRIYYTTDGSTPDIYSSAVYNVSATYFQPELNKPLTIDGPVIIKAVAVGFGKQNSRVATFQYDIRS